MLNLPRRWWARIFIKEYCRAKKNKIKALQTFFFCTLSPRRGSHCFEKHTSTLVTSIKASKVKTVHTKRKTIKSYPFDAQVSALSEETEKLFNILCKFGPLIGQLSCIFGLFWSLCTTVALSEGQICKECWITSRFSPIMQKLRLPGSNFWCYFARCALFGPGRFLRSPRS